MTPTLIVTRPLAQSARFTADVTAAWGRPLHVLISPLLQIEPLPVTMPEADILIFTSANGVKAATTLGLPKGLDAWCVGAKTTALAKEAGFETRTGPGDADGLVNDIIAAQPTGRIAHIRGTHTRGDVVMRLKAAGLDCVDVVAYDQVACALTPEAVAALNGSKPVILPLFSPRSCTILSRQGPFAAPISVVALSQAVKTAIDPEQNWQVSVAARPDVDAMMAALVNTLARTAV
ncbi:uroporphyrinogen-III synthase [Yoonia sp.]|uniref:uroporphyrinogen-III synthase n=1 Tax=Yoonia sp. TaxID=2212373 RepID=UPI0035C7A59C